MRYLIIVFLIIFATLIMCGFSVRYPVFGAEVDVLLVTMVLMIFFEKKLNPVIYAVPGGLIMDMLFARSIGFYTVPYLVCGLVTYLVSGNIQSRGITGSAVLCMVAQVSKEFCSIIICIILGYKFDILKRVLQSVLPGIIVQSLFCMILYFFYKWLYSYAFMQPVHDPEFKLVEEGKRRRRR